jgi:tripartite-type tricarboxylate transporter receptor subunit TctC
MNNALPRRSVLAAGLASLVPNVFAQGARPIAFIVPQPAGNPTDGMARKMQPVLQTALDQIVVVENLPGAGGSLGVRKALQTPANTPVLLIVSQTEPILTPLALAGASYKPEDMRVVGMVARAPYALASRADLPASNLTELLDLARRSKDKPLSHGHIGHGSMIHLLGEQFAKKMGITLTQVPYKGVPPVIQDLMGGQIDLTFLPLGGATANLIDSGKVRAYGVTTLEPFQRLPKLRPMAQLHEGLNDFVYGTWAAVLVPRSTPEPLVQRLHQALNTALQDAGVREYVSGTGLEPSPPLTLAQLQDFYLTETRLYQNMAQQVGITPQ